MKRKYFVDVSLLSSSFFLIFIVEKQVKQHH